MKNTNSSKAHQLALSRLDKLLFDTKEYRLALNRIFSRKLSRPRDGRKYFFDLLLCVSQLYLDYLFVRSDIQRLRDLCRWDDCGGSIRADLRREIALRAKFQKRLTALPCWAYFESMFAFSEPTGLRTLKDYLNSFILHLPEIHEETLRIEHRVERFRKEFDRSALASFEVGLLHMGKHHISFVQIPLQWAADEFCWKD